MILLLFFFQAKRPYPITPLSFTSNFGGKIYTNPSELISKYSSANVFDGGACTDAGPAKAVPVVGSYILP